MRCIETLCRAKDAPIYAHVARRGRHARGFTLAEVLATIAVLAIVLPVAMAAVSQSVRVAGITHEKAVALSLAQGKLDELVATGDWQSSGTNGDFGTGYPGYTWEMNANTWDQTDITEMEQVQVQVGWTSHGHPESVTLTTLVYVDAQTAPTSTTGGG